MESTTKKLIANAIGSTSVFKQLQSYFVTVFSDHNSLPSDFENRFSMTFIFWRSGLSLSCKSILPDFAPIISKKIIHEKITAKFLSAIALF